MDKFVKRVTREEYFALYVKARRDAAEMAFAMKCVEDNLVTFTDPKKFPLAMFAPHEVKLLRKAFSTASKYIH